MQREIPALRYTYCDHGDAVLSRVITEAGAVNLLIWCRTCLTNVSKAKGFSGVWISKSDPRIEGVDLATLPTAYTLELYRQCQGPCGRVALCQLHHWAPRKYFGEDADKWPTAWLCDQCHRKEWHAKVTPGLCTAFDPASYASFLIDSIGIDNAARLTRELVRLGLRKRQRKDAA